MSEPNSAKAIRRAEEEKSRKERKKYNIIVGVTVGVLVVLVVFALLFSSDLFYNKTTAVEINGYDFTAADFNFYYFTAYNNHYNTYGYYAQLGVTGLLPSSGTPFDEQICTLVDDEGKTTWADYFEDQALSLMSQVAMFCTEAGKDPNFSLSQEDKDAVDETIEGMRTQADTYGYPNLEGYLVQLYGKGMTEEVFRKNLERQATASAYATFKQESFTYTDQQIADHYTENADDFDFFCYRAYWFSGAAVTDDEDTEEDETMSLDDAMAKAEADAKAFQTAATSEQAFMDYAASLHEDDEDYDADDSTLSESQGSDLESDLIEDAYKWLIDPARKAGDVTVIGTDKDASSPGFYVLYFLERDNNQYQSVNGAYGFIPVNEDLFESDGETGDDADTDGDAADTSDEAEEEDHSEEIREANIAIAQEVLEDFNAHGTLTIDGFTEFMSSEENADLVTGSGSLESLGRHDGPKEVCDWFFDPARKVGDTAVIYVEGSGTYILFFSELGKTYADVISDTDLRINDANEWTTNKLTAYTPDKQWEMVLTKNMASLN